MTCCVQLQYVLSMTPKNMPWMLDTMLVEKKGVDAVPGVVMHSSKKGMHEGRPYLVRYCPFCGTNIDPLSEPEPPKRRYPWLFDWLTKK